MLDEDRSGALFDYLSLDSDRHPAAPDTSAQLAALLSKLGSETERGVAAIQRLEQGFLRRTLLPGRSGKCALCSEDLPVELLVAANVKKRSACSPAERLDIPAVAMPACRLGCDALFEAGLVAVDATGLIQSASMRFGREPLVFMLISCRDVSVTRGPPCASPTSPGTACTHIGGSGLLPSRTSLL